MTEADYSGSPESGRRSIKLYSILSSYLKNRPLKVLRSVATSDGYEVWRRLVKELEPSSRARSLAMAQALVGFPAMSKNASLTDYVLTYEKLVAEYEKLSLTSYDENLRIGTLMKGIPSDLRRHMLVDMTASTTYSEVRARLLEYERSSQTWSAEHILSSLSVANPSHHGPKLQSDYQGPIPMELDRIKGNGKGKGHGKGHKGKGPGRGKGISSKGRGRGKGRRRGKGRGKGK